MKLSYFAVRRPITTIMVMLVVIIIGGISFSRLPIDLMPDITYPVLSVSASYKDASPDEVEQLITRPIEEAMSVIPGVDQVSSASAEGVSRVRISFNWGTDLDAAANDIRDRLERVLPRLPDDIERPQLRKFDLASFPVLILGASGDMDPIQMRRIIDNQVKYRIERLPGVAALDVFGGLDREIHVNLSADKIKALGLSIDRILAKIRAENVNIPAGNLERGNLNVMIRTPGEYTSLRELGDTVISMREGVPVQLKEIASVEDSWQKITRVVRVNGRPGIRLAVNKQSGKNTVDVAKGVRKEIEEVNRDIPQIRLTTIIDTSDFIQKSISNVGTMILYGGILAILVLLLFLRNIGSTAVIVTAIPISIIGTFALMYFGGFTLNLMTLGGLALGIGMLVDNAIVVLENIYRMRESGVEPEKAAVEGSEEVSAAILASTLTTLAVFLPLIFIRGMSGVMFKQFCFVVSFALCCALIVALTLVPMLTSRIPSPATADRTGRVGLGRRIFLLSGRLFKAMEDNYAGLLRFALNHRFLVISGTALLLTGSLFLIPYVGSEFMPATDEGEVRVYADGAVGTRLEVLDESYRKMEALIKSEVPEVRNMETFFGSSGYSTRGAHTGQIRISLKPQAERTRSSEEIAGFLRSRLMGIPGVRIRTRAGQGLFIMRMGSGGGERIEVEIRGHDLETADELARRVEEVVKKVDGVTDARVSRESGTPEELIIVDRQKASDMKLTVSQIADMLQTVLSGTRASYFRESGNEYRILVKLKEVERMDLGEILDLTLTNADGQPVVLRNVVQVRPRSGPVRIQRKDQERIVTVSANITGRDTGSIINDMRSAFRSIPVPSDFSILFGGDYEEQQDAFRELLLSLVMAIMLVYMVMASLYESLRDPFVVMFSVPIAAIGVILMLLLTDTTFNVQTFIGCIMLGGIVVNNAILLVDHINLLYRRRGMPLREAIQEAGRRRLRPILMTATTTMLAMVPLAIGMGEGGEAQAPMARAVIGGLFSSSFITLVFIPTIYSFSKGSSGKEGKGKKG
ncbi:efflux RND transporter permease subunit [Thermodesulfobacteriota bacterium]